MLPTYKPGDHVLTFNWVRPIVGDAVVFEMSNKTYIKRVVKVNRGFVRVEGDNKQETSRVGPIDSSQIIGKVILKY